MRMSAFRKPPFCFRTAAAGQVPLLLVLHVSMSQAVFMLMTALIMRRGTSTVFMSLALGLGGLSWAGGQGQGQGQGRGQGQGQGQGQGRGPPLSG